MAVPLLPLLLPPAIAAATKIIDRLVPDKHLNAKLKVEMEKELATHLSKVDLAQLAVNKEEAKHKSMFVAGWRPFIGWTCGVGVAYAFVFRPLFVDVVATIDPAIKLPSLQVGELMTLLLGMLGMAGYRTFEKMKGVASSGMKQTIEIKKAAKVPTKDDDGWAAESDGR